MSLLTWDKVQRRVRFSGQLECRDALKHFRRSRKDAAPHNRDVGGGGNSFFL